MAGKLSPSGQHPATPDPNLNGQQLATPADETSAPTADSNEQAETIAWDAAVSEGKVILAKIAETERSKLRLGELAHKVVHPKYGDRTFAKYAETLGIDKNTLGHFRTTYRAWQGILPPAAKSTPYAVLEALATVDDRVALITAEPKMSKRRAEVHRVLKDDPHRAEILSEYPDLTCTRKARELMDRSRGGCNGKGNGKGGFSKDKQRYLKDVCTRAEDLGRKAEEAFSGPSRWQAHAGKFASGRQGGGRTRRGPPGKAKAVRRLRSGRADGASKA
jgi:hypothetical protein